MSEQGTGLSHPTVLTGLITAFSLVVVGVISFFGGRGQAQAAIQATITAGFTALLEQHQKDHAELIEERDELKLENEKLRGELRQAIQVIYSMRKALAEAGIEVPLTVPSEHGILEFKPEGEVQHG